MAEIKLKLTGWQAAIAVVVIIALLGVRMVSMKDLTGEADLMREIYQQLTYEYFPDDVERLKAAQASGDDAALQKLAESVTSSKVTIESVKGSSPLIGLSAPYDVVVKVDYSLDDSSGNRKTDTVFYLFEKRTLPGGYRFKHETTVVSYYLNFL